MVEQLELLPKEEVVAAPEVAAPVPKKVKAQLMIPAISNVFERSELEELVVKAGIGARTSTHEGAKRAFRDLVHALQVVDAFVAKLDVPTPPVMVVTAEVVDGA